MINTKSPLYSKWLARQAKNPPKCKDYLETRIEGKIVGNCCLGNACRVAKLKTNVIFDGLSTSFGSKTDNTSRSLPIKIQRELNIRGNGAFTPEGKAKAKGFLSGLEINCSDTVCGLAAINDTTVADHKTIGALIQYLALVEEKTDVEMFRKPL